MRVSSDNDKVVISDRMCQWRKDPYLPSDRRCVRHLPRTNVLACSMFVPAFRHCFAAPKVSPDHPSGEKNSRFSLCDSLTFISRRKGCCVGYKFSKAMHLPAIASRCFYCVVMFCNLLYDICLLYVTDVFKTCNRLAWSL